MIEAMKYTKWITVLFCLLGLAACRQDAPRFRIGVAQCSDDSWRHKMNDEILREAMFYDGVSVEIRSAADDNRKQAEDVHYFIDKGDSNCGGGLSESNTCHSCRPEDTF